MKGRPIIVRILPASGPGRYWVLLLERPNGFVSYEAFATLSDLRTNNG